MHTIEQMLKFTVFLRISLFCVLIFCIGILTSPVKVSAAKADIQTADAGGGPFFAINGGDQAVMDSTSADSEPEEFSKPKMLLYSSYTVKTGDTIGNVAKKYALDNGTLMSVNGLKTDLIRPGQTLRIPNQDGIILKVLPEPPYISYKVKKGDTISEVAKKHNIEAAALMSANGLENDDLIEIDQTLRIPQDKITLISDKGKETVNNNIADIAGKYDDPKKYNDLKKYKIDDTTKKFQVSLIVTSIQSANEIFADKLGRETKELFIAGVKMDTPKPKEVTGDIWIWPARGRLTDSFGRRSNPFGGGSSEFHNGMDISAKTGTPVRAALPGRVITAVYDHPSYGNYVVITHSGGFRTLYAHLSAIKTQSGAYVNAGELIGAVGSTGRSTGPHLHFTVYKNGATVNPRIYLK